MKAIQVNEPGGAEQLHLHECVIPQYGPDDVLVQIKAAGLNYIDIYIRTGLYKPPAYPYVPGKEGSGIITEVGENVRHFKVGDRVAFCTSGSGTYAEFTAIPANQIVRIPEQLSFDMAAAVMLQGSTAYYLSHLTFLLDKRHTILIHAGAGGVGLLLIQMAKMLGAKVITTVSTENKAELAKSAGADYVINYTKESFYESVMKYTDKKGVNVVYDAVGKTTFDDSLRVLSTRGLLVSYGQASGPVAPFELRKLAEKSLYITRPSLHNYTLTQAELNDITSAVFDMILQNKLKVTIGQRYPLSEAGKAQAELEARNTVGKSILVVN
jgi:NADPH2:quinone reductase